MRAYKAAKGIDVNDAGWDRNNFKVYARSAKKLLEAFDGDHIKAMAYMISVGQNWDDDGIESWTLPAIARHAWDNRGKFTEKTNEQSGVKVGAVSVLGRDRHSSITHSGKLAGEALRAIGSDGVHGERTSDMGGDWDASFEG